MATKVELELGSGVPDSWETPGSERPQRQRQRERHPFLLADSGTKARPLSQSSQYLSSVMHPGGRRRTPASIQQESVFVGTLNKGRPCLCRTGILSLLPVAVSEAACLKGEVLNLPSSPL